MRISDWSSDVCSSDLASQQRYPATQPEPRSAQCACGTALAQACVKRLGGANLFGLRAGPHRLVFDDLAVAADGCGERADPVVIAVLAAVLDDAHPRPVRLQRLPEVGKGGLGHVGVAHEVVRVRSEEQTSE